MRKSDATPGRPASDLIDEKIAGLGDWRGKTLSRMRKLIKEADPDVVEEWKWMGTPVWSHDGIICTGESYKSIVKLTFAKGASLEDPDRLFNSSLDGNVRRAIDIREGEKIDAGAFKALIREAIAFNTSGGKARGVNAAPRVSGQAGKSVGGGVKETGARKSRSTRASVKKAAAATTKGSATMAPDSGTKRTANEPDATRRTSRSTKSNRGKPVLLAGGNPRIAKADGDAPVQSYIDAMPGWKRDTGRRLDRLIARTAPKARKAVRWNSPFYGIEGQGWFLSFHVFTRYVKVTFFRGTLLRPAPPGGTGKDARWIDVHENDLDERQMSAWIRQAAALPGWGKS